LDLSSVPANFQSAFTGAAAKWGSVITGDLEDIPVDAATRKDSTCTNLPSVIDDVFICAFLTAIDGPQGVLGSAGPEFARFGKTVTPSIGYMEFDTADAERLAAAGQFGTVVVSYILSTCVVKRSQHSLALTIALLLYLDMSYLNCIAT